MVCNVARFNGRSGVARTLIPISASTNRGTRSFACLAGAQKRLVTYRRKRGIINATSASTHPGRLTGRAQDHQLERTRRVSAARLCSSKSSSLLQNHTRTVVLRWKWTAKEGDVSGCYGDSCDVLRFNEVCKHCREVQPAGSRLFDERQADRCYHHADVASASIPDDASRACLRIDGIEDHPEDRPRILPKTILFQGRTSFIPTCCRSLPPFALNTLSLKQGSIDTGRRGCGRLSLNKHGLECEQQQSKEKLYVSSWTDVPCARCQGITDRNQVISLTLHGLSLQRPPATVRNANSAPHLPRQPSLFLPEKAKKSP